MRTEFNNLCNYQYKIGYTLVTNNYPLNQYLNTSLLFPHTTYFTWEGLCYTLSLKNPGQRKLYYVLAALFETPRLKLRDTAYELMEKQNTTKK